eukprot:gene19271-6539_t
MDLNRLKPTNTGSQTPKIPCAVPTDTEVKNDTASPPPSTHPFPLSVTETLYSPVACSLCDN